MSLSHDLDNARYERMRWNTPLSEEHAVLLLSRLDIRPGASLVDLGCGWGELLLRAVDSAGVTTGIGVDTDQEALARGRSLAADRGLDGRVTFIGGPADAWQQPADRVICVGAAHAWGGAEAAWWSAPLRRRMLGAPPDRGSRETSVAPSSHSASSSSARNGRVGESSI